MEVDHAVAKTLAPLPEKTCGVDTSSGFETKLIGERSGTVKIPDEVSHKVPTGVGTKSLKYKNTTTIACDEDYVDVAETGRRPEKTGHYTPVISGIVCVSNEVGAKVILACKTE